MAFRITTDLVGYEFRSLRSGTSVKSGAPWLSLVLEGEDAEQLDVSVPSELQGPVITMSLAKGDLVTCRVLAVSTQNYSYLRLLEPPVRHGDGSVAGVDY